MTFQQKVDLYNRLKQRQPDIASFIDGVSKTWPGAKVTYVQIGVESYGTTCSIKFPAVTGPLFEQTARRKKK